MSSVKNGFYKWGLAVGCLFVFISILMDSMSNHALVHLLLASGKQAQFSLAGEYLRFHSLALIVFSMLMKQHPNQGFILVMLVLFIGTSLFAGSLYLGSLYGFSSMFTPLGGATILIGWLFAILFACKIKCQ